MTLRDRIKELANKRGMSLPTLESELGFGNGTIVKWDKASPNTDKLAKVADYFHVSVDYLLGREESVNSDVNNDPDENYAILSRNAKKLSPEKREQLLDMAKIMFREEFDN